MDIIYLMDSDVKEFITFLVVTHVERYGLKKKTCSVLDFRANLLNHTKPLSISSYLDKEQDYVPMLSALTKFSHILEIVPSTRPAHKYLQVGM